MPYFGRLSRCALKKSFLVLVAFCVLSFLGASSVRAQFTILSQDRTLSLDNYLGAEDISPQRDQDMAAGSYGNTLSFNDDPVFDGSVSQSSVVSSLSLSASGSASANCNAGMLDGGQSVTTVSTYTVDFTVELPTLVTYSDQYSQSSNFTRTGVVSDAQYATSLTSSGQPSTLFQFGTLADNQSFSNTFSQVLEPGQTYTLQSTASAYVSLSLPNHASGSQATFQFSFASVPEPASAGVLLCLGAILFQRRPQRRIIR